MAGWLKRAIARALRDIADRVVALPAPERPSNAVVSGDELGAKRREHAMSMMDDDCHGYLLVRLVRDDGDEFLVPDLVMPAEARPAIRELLSYLADELGS